MKTKIILLLFLSVIAIGCQKNKTGDLVVYAEDNMSTPIVGEYVYLYNSLENFNNVTYDDLSTTDSDGKVKFSNLEPGVYYVDLDFDNAVGGTTTIQGSGTVKKKHITTITIRP